MLKVTTRILTMLVLAITATTVSLGNDVPSATDLLANADKYRNFTGKSFTFDIKLNSKKPGESNKVFVLQAKILDSHTSLVIYAEPVGERGKALLMDQRNLWFHSPTSSKSIRITPQQRLLGEASSGDVASTDFSADYIPTYLRQETVDDVSCHVLALTAKPDGLATYNKLHLWLRVEDSRPYKAEFFATSGKLLKTARYTRYENLDLIGGKPQLMTMEITDSMSKGKMTILEYSNFQVVNLPKYLFNASTLNRIR